MPLSAETAGPCEHLHLMLPGTAPAKRTLPGEKWPSNVWPDETKILACAMLTCRRIGMDPEIIMHEQILTPARKGWGLGVPNYNGNWEPHAKKALGFALPVEDSSSSPSSDDADFYPPLDSEEMQKRRGFIDLLDEIK